MNGAMFQMIAHGISSAGMFFLVGVIYDRAHHRNLNDFGGLSQLMPLYRALTTLGFFAALGLPGLCGFVAEVMSCRRLSTRPITRFQLLVLISVIGIVLTAAFLLWAMQRVFLGPLNEKYKDFPDMNCREVFCQAPLLFLCVAARDLPLLPARLDASRASRTWSTMLSAAGGS